MRIPTFKDLALYVAISTLIIGGVCVLFYAGMSWDFFSKWVCFAVMTAFLLDCLFKIRLCYGVREDSGSS
jgi:uncharacterized membrane protein